MSENAVAKKDPANANVPQEQREQQLIDAFANAYVIIAKEMDVTQQEAQEVYFKPHPISLARNIITTLQETSQNISTLSEKIGEALKSPQGSPEYKTYLLQEIANLKADQKITLDMQKDMNKSEKCGANELEKIAKEKDLWTNAFFGGLFATVGAAATLATASSGQSLCLSLLTGTIAFSLLAATKAKILADEHRILEKVVQDGDYWCNSGPQRPGTKKVIGIAFANTRQKIQQSIHLN